MSPKTRIALTFLLVVLAVAIWGVSQLPVSYDRSALGDGERVFAACLFMLAIVLNLPGLVKRKKRPHHAAAVDYYVHFDEAGHHVHAPAAHPGRPQHPGAQPHHAPASGHARPAHPDHDHEYDRRH